MWISAHGKYIYTKYNYLTVINLLTGNSLRKSYQDSQDPLIFGIHFRCYFLRCISVAPNPPTYMHARHRPQIYSFLRRQSFFYYYKIYFDITISKGCVQQVHHRTMSLFCKILITMLKIVGQNQKSVLTLRGSDTVTKTALVPSVYSMVLKRHQQYINMQEKQKN